VNVPRVVLVFLVFVLSGTPASAVLCDMVLCSEAAPAISEASAGCHEHAATSGGERALSAADGCSHLSFIAPFLTPGPRGASSDAAAAVVIDVPRHQHPLVTALAADPARRPAPRHIIATPFRPLRI
jgi:hypothetical protein